MSGDDIDVAVVGAGPAGLAAATAAAAAGVRVALVDAGGQPGGQFWRHADESVREDDGAGHHGWDTYLRLSGILREQVEAGHITYLPLHQVWTIERGDGFMLRLTAAFGSAPPRVASLRAVAVVLCPGGYDRQLPVPGWTLPGVMGAGGVQALLKGSGTLAGRRAVVAGTGPFLLPVAAALAEAGATVVGLCEANRPSRWLREIPGAARTPGKALEAAGYAWRLARHRVPYLSRTAVTRIHGDEVVGGARLSRLDADGAVVPGRDRDVEVDLVALGWGFTPSVELAVALGARTVRDPDGSLVTEADGAQRSSVPGVYVAGELTGVGGAAMAVAEGELAGLTVAAALGGRAAPGRRTARLRRTVRRSRAFAVAMHNAHQVPARWHEWPDGETVLCRCEEVTVDAVRAAQDDLGAADPRAAKSTARPGMGWCQGRMCGFAAAELLAARTGRRTTADDLRPLATRPVAAPLTLGELAEPDPPPP